MALLNIEHADVLTPFETPVESSPRGRVDGDLKVMGRMPYTADIYVPGSLHAAVLRSPHPHARIVSIDATAAKALPGVRAVLTGADVPSILYGRGLKDVPLLATSKVRFIGEPVAAVAAESAEIAEVALRLIQVQYEPLPAVFNAEDALAPDAPTLHDDPARYTGAAHKQSDPPNVVATVRVSAGPDVEQALAGADHVFERTFHVARVHQGFVEPSCCTVSYTASGHVRVWSTNKAPYRLREILGDAFDLDQQDIELFTTAVGGDFGGKGSPTDVPLCLELSRRTGRPVRLQRRHTDDLAAGSPAPSAIFTIRLGVSTDGRIQAMDARGLFNAGAYGGFTPGVASRSVPGTCYRIPSVRVETLRVYTNEVPNGNMRAPSAPQTTFAMEAMMEHVARGLGLDPFEFRRRNLLASGEPTYQGTVWHENRLREVLDAAERACPPLVAPPGKPHLRLGRGVAAYDRATHLPQPTSLRLRLLPDGRLEAQVAITETGTGSHTMLQAVLASELGLARQRIVVRYVGTADLPWDEGVGGSRVTVGTTEAAVLAARTFERTLASAAAQELDVLPDQVVVQPGGRALADDGRDLDLVELAARGVTVEAMGEVDGQQHGDGAVNACVQVAQVGVDMETGQVYVLDLLSAHDVAEILNPVGHQGQIEGGVVMGLGAAMSEDLGLVEGRVTAAHLGDYKLPTAADVPPLRTVLLPGSRGVGARNVKSIGEMSNVPIAVAVANAASNAIGATLDSLPLTPERVLAALSPR